MQGQLILLILILGSSYASLAVEVGRHTPLDPTAFGVITRLPPVNDGSTVEQLTNEFSQLGTSLANKTYEDFKASMEAKFGNAVAEEARDINTALGRFLDSKNIDNASARGLMITPAEAKMLSGILLMAMEEQATTGNSRRAFTDLANQIKIKLNAAAELSPEGRALRNLANDTAEVLKPSDKLKANLATARGRLRDSMAALTDEKIDGKGLDKMMRTALFTGSSLGQEVLDDVKAATRPKQLLRTLENLVTLGNVANPDPISKSFIHKYMAYELGVERMVFDDRGKVDWSHTIDRVAKTAPNDARAAIGALADAGAIGRTEAQNALIAVGRTETARQVVQDFSAFIKKNGGAPTVRQYGEFAPQYLAGVAYYMGKEGQLDPEVAQKATKAFSAMAVAGSLPGAVEATQQIIANSKLPRYDYHVFDSLKKQVVLDPDVPVRLPPPPLEPLEIAAPNLLQRPDGSRFR